MKTSIISYAFNKHHKLGNMDLFGYLETVKYRYGLTGADLWSGTFKSLDEDYLKLVKDALEERELELANIAVDGPCLWVDDAEGRAANREQFLKWMDAAEFLGAKTLRIDAGVREKNLTFTNEQFDWIVKLYKEYAKRAGNAGYKVGPENHWGPEDVPGNMLAIAEAVNDPAWGLLLHFDRWYGPDADKGDQMLAKYTMHTHLWPGTTEVLQAKMGMLRALGYDGYWGTEMVSLNYFEIGSHLNHVKSVLESWRQAG
ncbi:MAG: sugar phosphate isomerase/epimerase family protein [Anaerolineae bacterium]|jgi:sugar phosphate isomerase/epimerase